MSRFKTAILEKVCHLPLKELAETSDIRDLTHLSYNQQVDLIEDFDAVIIKSVTQIDKNFLTRAKKLKVIGRVGVGVDHIDQDELKKRSIHLVTTPGGNAIATAEFTLMAILMMLKRSETAFEMMRQKNFNRMQLMGYEINQKTVGIIGLGHVGIELAKRLSMFCCRLLACTGKNKTFVEDFKALPHAKFCEKMDEVVAHSDIITIHASLNETTKHLFNQKVFSKMKKGTYFVNTARAEVVDPDALLFALENDILAHASLDLLFPELPYNDSDLMATYQNPFLGHPKVTVTPHIAALTRECQTSMMQAIVNQLQAFFQQQHCTTEVFDRV